MARLGVFIATFLYIHQKRVCRLHYILRTSESIRKRAYISAYANRFAPKKYF